jgi:hypothetical protein
VAHDFSDSPQRCSRRCSPRSARGVRNENSHSVSAAPRRPSTLKRDLVRLIALVLSSMKKGRGGAGNGRPTAIRRVAAGNPPEKFQRGGSDKHVAHGAR